MLSPGCVLLLTAGLASIQTAAAHEHCLADVGETQCRALRAYSSSASLGKENQEPQNLDSFRKTLWIEEFRRGSHTTNSDGIRYDELRQLLTTLDMRPATKLDRSFFEALLNWLQDLLEPEDHSKAPAWLVEFLESLQEADLENILGWLPYLLTTILLLMLAGVLFNEIKATRRIRRGEQYQGGERKMAGDDEVLPPADNLESVLALPAARQPAALLRLSIENLMHAEHVPRDRSLTNTELAAEIDRGLGTRNSSLAAAFRQLCSIAEDCVYGDQVPDPARQALAYELAHKLVRQTLQPAHAGTGNSQ